ncbi:TetR-like C-terminal domain-containing protein, partial [Streptomyces sp. NPDC058953]|uniref:TetR-like C-terminal domain-containing protein n=1 Tax=Streptomyces sp. NPDC058953 TaxID=3346676 RepID=UPI0036AAD481
SGRSPCLWAWGPPPPSVFSPPPENLHTPTSVDAYDAIGAAAEAALAATPADTAPVDRWTAVCTAVRAWALAHPHEYALIYGSPVPGYTAPGDTIGPAARVGLAMITVVRDAAALAPLTPPPLDPALTDEAERLAAGLAPDLPPAAVAAMVAAWAEMFGLLSFELFGQFHRVVEDRDAFFAQAVARLAYGVGLPPRT